MSYIVGVDVGTTSTKAVLYDKHARILGQASRYSQLFRDSTGMAELDPEQLVENVVAVIREAVAQVDGAAQQVAAVAFSSANQSVLLLDQNHRTISRVITWADTRAAAVADSFRQSLSAESLYMRTGTPIHPMSPLIKLMWLQQAHPDVMTKTCYVADIKSYLFYRFFGCFKVDISVASGTGMFNINQRDWDADAVKRAGITIDQLPTIVNGTEQERKLRPAVAQALGLPATTPFVYGAFDGATANLGVGALHENTIAITIGTSAAVRVVTDHPVIDPQQRLFCYALDKYHWVIGGPLNNGGDVYQWAVNQLLDGHMTAQNREQRYARANQLITSTPAGAHGLLFYPFLGGERAPLWDADAQGSFYGLSELHTRADMLRAVLEGINMNIASVYQLLVDLVGKPKKVTATGGFARSSIWRQMLPDILDVDVEIPNRFESGCLGAAGMAMQSLGMVDDLTAVEDFIGEKRYYAPRPTQADVYQRILPIFTQLESIMQPGFKMLTELQGQLADAVNDEGH